MKIVFFLKYEVIGFRSYTLSLFFGKTTFDETKNPHQIR